MRSTATGATARSRTSPSECGPGRRPRLADLGGLRRPRRRRRPRPLRLPLRRLGRRAPDALPRLAEDDAASYCDPPRLPSLPDHVFRNDGGRFVDVTAEAGIVDATAGAWAWSPPTSTTTAGSTCSSPTTDGQLPLPQPGRIPLRGGRRDLGRRRQRRRRLPGRHGDRLRRPRRRRPARPGRDELLRRVDDALPQPRRRPLRRPLRARSGCSSRPGYLLGFGIAFLDVNNDGRLDLAIANGHVNDYRPAESLRDARPAPGRHRRRPARRRLRDAPGPPGRSRGSAAGWPPATWTTTAGSTCVILAQNEPLAYFHNRTAGRPLS